MTHFRGRCSYSLSIGTKHFKYPSFIIGNFRLEHWNFKMVGTFWRVFCKDRKFFFVIFSWYSYGMRSVCENIAWFYQSHCSSCISTFILHPFFPSYRYKLEKYFLVSIFDLRAAPMLFLRSFWIHSDEPLTYRNET